MLWLVHSDQGLSEKDPYKPSIFLAGPSPRGYGEGHPPDWRDTAIPMFEERQFHGRLFIPRPTSGNSSNYDGQIEWELHHLNLADCIMFWIPRKYPVLKGATTNVEFGMWVRDRKTIYGRPDSADQIRYLDHLYKKYLDRTPYNDLADTIDAALDTAGVILQYRS